MTSVSTRIARRLVSTSRLWTFQRPLAASLTAEGASSMMIEYIQLGKYDVICDILPSLEQEQRVPASIHEMVKMRGMASMGMGRRRRMGRREMARRRRREVGEKLGSFLWLHLPSPSPPLLSFLPRRRMRRRK